jgi:integrase
MRVYRQTFTQGGRRRVANAWYVEVRWQERRWRFSGFTDKTATEALGRALVRLASLRAAGERPDPALARAIEGWPSRIRERAVRIGLLDPAHSTGMRPLEDLFTEFEATLRSRDRSPKHVSHVVGRARRLAEGCGFRFWSDISAPRLERHLRTLREGGLSVKTSNHLLASLRQFTRWAVTLGLAAEDPLRALKPLNARVDPRRTRRSLAEHELRSLIGTTRQGPVRSNLTGPERALLYTLAAETGLRANELRSLRVSSFDLDSERPTVTLQASASKRRREDVLPLRHETARTVEAILRGRGALERAFALPRGWRPPRMLREDLKAAGVPYRDESGRVADFHALRVTFVSTLVRAGVDARTVQALARHSTPTLTLGIYAKLASGAEREALARLPDLAPPVEGDAALATGTENSLASSLAFDAAGTLRALPLHAARDATEGVPESEDGGGGGNRTRVPESLRASPATCVVR